MLRLLARDSTSDRLRGLARSIRAKSSKAGKRPNEYSRRDPVRLRSRQAWSRPARSFFHPRHVLRVVVLAVTVLGRPDAQEKLEGVAEVIPVVAIQSIGAIVDGELGAQTDVDTLAMRQVADVADRYPLTGKISDSSKGLRTSSWPDFWTRSQRK